MRAVCNDYFRGGAAIRALVLALIAVACTSAAFAQTAPETDELLRRADQLKTSSPLEFHALLATLEKSAATMTPQQRRYTRYLQGWRHAYAGEYDLALAELKPVIEQSDDATLEFRARATAVNVNVVATRYEDAFTGLTALTQLLPQVADVGARQQGLAVIAFLYNQVGEYELGLDYAQKLIDENPTDRGNCVGWQLRLEALFGGGRAKAASGDFDTGVDSCTSAGETTYANLIRTYVAKLHMNGGQYETAIALLEQYYPQVQEARYPRLIAEYDALLAAAYRETGNSALVRRYASRALASGVNNQFIEPIVTAHRLLYLLAKEQGETREALAHHERYASADKGYLDDVSARQLAYQRVSHAVVADKLRIDTLNKENEVLQLQRALDKKRVETSSLYIALLILVTVTIAFWAYRTKRSQLHFMRLSQIDGLTAIANRPRFIELAESALENAAKSRQEVCVVLCDLDHFKSINDAHGHAAGDFVLKQTVAACQMHLRTSDIFGRFGGEEFGVVLPGCSLEDARQRAEQLRLAIAAISGNYAGLEVSISASFGVASSAASGFELRQLLAHADAALYRAKHAGRNCVVVADARGAEPAAAASGRYGFGEGAADAMARVASPFF